MLPTGVAIIIIITKESGTIVVENGTELSECGFNSGTLAVGCYSGAS